jgi:hypothetical protein
MKRLAMLAAAVAEPRTMECPVKINGKLGRVWRGDGKADKIVLDPNEVALFEVK